MSRIHVASPSGSRAVFDEDQIRSGWGRGLLQPDSLYWMEGMEDWRPLSEFFTPEDPAPAVPGPPPLPSGPVFAYTRDPQSLTAFLVVMLWISLGSEVLSMLSDLGQMALLSESYTEAEADANDLRQAFVGLTYFVVFVVTGVAFLMWTYRANLNCRGFAAGMRFTPGWAVGHYFIPFLNLVRPYQAMKEIWQVSHDPPNWPAQRGSALLGWWWALWLASGFLGQIVFRMSIAADTVETLRTSTMVSIFSSVAGLPLCLVAITMVRTISEKQEELVTGSRVPEGARSID